MLIYMFCVYLACMVATQLNELIINETIHTNCVMKIEKYACNNIAEKNK